MRTSIIKQVATLVAFGMFPAVLLAQANEPAKGAATPSPAATTTAPATTPPPGSVIGFRLTQRPVATIPAAKQYASEWITAGYLTDHKVGKVTAIGGLYVANLLSTEPPGRMLNQLLIRKRDGFGVLVYPGNPKQPTAEQMIGMAGLEGMSGMSGMKAIQARGGAHGTFKTGNTRQARRLVDAWLLVNSLPDLYAGETRDFGGIFVTRIVDEAGRPKNQAVMRKTDGYIQMTDPVAAIDAKKP